MGATSMAGQWTVMEREDEGDVEEEEEEEEEHVGAARE